MQQTMQPKYTCVRLNLCKTHKTKQRYEKQAMATHKTCVFCWLGNSGIFNYCIWHAHKQSHSARVQCVILFASSLSSFSILRSLVFLVNARNQAHLEHWRRCLRKGICSDAKRKQNQWKWDIAISACSRQHVDTHTHTSIQTRSAKKKRKHIGMHLLQISKPIRFQVTEALIKTKQSQKWRYPLHSH